MVPLFDGALIGLLRKQIPLMCKLFRPILNATDRIGGSEHLFPCAKTYAAHIQVSWALPATGIEARDRFDVLISSVKVARNGSLSAKKVINEGSEIPAGWTNAIWCEFKICDLWFGGAVTSSCDNLWSE